MLAEEMGRRFLSNYSKLFEKVKIVEYCVCLKYSYVEVEGPEGKALGCAYVPFEDLSPGEVGSAPDPEKVIEGISSLNPLTRSLYLAMINAYCQYSMWVLKEERYEVLEGNLIDHLRSLLPGGAKVCCIGNIGPIVRSLREMGYEVMILERNPSLREEGVFPDVYAKRVIPECDAVISTGTVVLNDTVDDVLELSKGARVKVIVGPTAQFSPKILPGFDYYASIFVEDIDGAKEILRRGGWAFNETSRYYVIRP